MTPHGAGGRELPSGEGLPAVSFVVTARVIDEERRRLCDLLNEYSGKLRDASRALAVAEHAYRQAHATAVLAATGTALDRKAHADKASGIEMLNRNKWDAEKEFSLEECRNIRKQIDILAAEAYVVNAETRLV